MNRSTTKSIKSQLHPRNQHRQGYDFLNLIKLLPELGDLVRQNQYGILSINFADPKAVKLLNKALLMQFYGIKFWDIPDNYLCPPIPGRADYIHYLADLLSQDNHGKIPYGRSIRVLDVGVGANAIYPIIGHAEYGWSFIGSDINPIAIKMAKLIAKTNSSLGAALECRWQPNQHNIFKHIIKTKEHFALTLCNPPFHASNTAAEGATQRKLQNLGQSSQSSQPLVRNFGGQNTELWCEGGESTFITNMVTESINHKHQCLWFSSLVSKKQTLPIIQRQLNHLNAEQVVIVTMEQGQKISRFIAWSFYNQTQRQQLLADWQK